MLYFLELEFGFYIKINWPPVPFIFKYGPSKSYIPSQLALNQIDSSMLILCTLYVGIIQSSNTVNHHANLPVHIKECLQWNINALNWPVLCHLKEAYSSSVFHWHFDVLFIPTNLQIQEAILNREILNNFSHIAQLEHLLSQLNCLKGPNIVLEDTDIKLKTSWGWAVPSSG